VGQVTADYKGNGRMVWETLQSALARM